MLVGEAAVPVPVAVPVGEAVVLVVPVARVWPRLGSLTFPSTSQPPAVEDGQAGGVNEGLYAELATPVGVNDLHCFWRLVKSGATGVGVPRREIPA